MRRDLTIALCLVCAVALAVIASVAVIRWFADGQECQKHVSAVHSTLDLVPDDIRSFGAVAEHVYVDYTWCYERGRIGLVTLDAATTAELRARYRWEPTEPPYVEPSLAAYAPADPEWAESAGLNDEGGRPGWRVFALDRRSGRVYYRDAYEYF